MVNGAVILVPVPQTGSVKYSSHGQTEIGSVGVDDHGGPDIISLERDENYFIAESALDFLGLIYLLEYKSKEDPIPLVVGACLRYMSLGR